MTCVIPGRIAQWMRLALPKPFVHQIVALSHDSAYSFSMTREIPISVFASSSSLLLGLLLVR
jgi:hypothetical protein